MSGRVRSVDAGPAATAYPVADVGSTYTKLAAGGAFRHAEPAARDAALAGLLTDPGTRGLLGGASLVLDEHYVLAPAGLLAGTDTPTASALLRRYLLR